MRLLILLIIVMSCLVVVPTKAEDGNRIIVNGSLRVVRPTKSITLFFVDDSLYVKSEKKIEVYYNEVKQNNSIITLIEGNYTLNVNAINYLVCYSREKRESNDLILVLLLLIVILGVYYVFIQEI